MAWWNSPRVRACVRVQGQAEHAAQSVKDAAGATAGAAADTTGAAADTAGAAADSAQLQQHRAAGAVQEVRRMLAADISPLCATMLAC